MFNFHIQLNKTFTHGTISTGLNMLKKLKHSTVSFCKDLLSGSTDMAIQSAYYYYHYVLTSHILLNQLNV